MSAGLITIFGGSGFIGRHLTGKLAERGYQIRLAGRDTEKAAQLITQGDVGQIAGIQANIRNVPSIERAVAGADIVINLVGLLYEGGPQKFEAVHAVGAGNVAAAAKAAGARQLIHMSALGADAKSESAYARTKAKGEELVTEAFEGATILRPSVIFGKDDDFTNKFGKMSAMAPALPLGEGGKNLMQPLWIEDLVSAIVKIIENADLQGKCYELGGPNVLSMAEIIDIITGITGRFMPVVPVPYAMMGMMGVLMGLMPGKPPLTSDQVKLTKSDNVVAADAAGFAALGIDPKPFQAASLEHLKRFRKGGGLTESHA